MNIGEKIKSLRKTHQLTQEELGNHLHVAYQTVSKWENGETLPDLHTLIAIANYFSVTTDELLGLSAERSSNGYRTSREKLLTIYECGGSEKDFEMALAEYQQVLLHGNPTTQDYMLYAYLFDVHSKRDIEKAENYYKKALTHGDASRDEYWLQARQQLTMLLVRTNRGEEAVSQVLDCLEKEPENVEAYISAAFAYKEVGDDTTAYQYIRKGETLNPRHITLLTIGGDICEHLGNYEQAFHYWDQAFAVNPEYCSCLYSKAALYEKMGDKEKALASWKEVLDWHFEHGYHIGPELDLPVEHIKMLEANCI